jgi:electron transfer flavoprotein alpha subunit
MKIVVPIKQVPLVDQLKFDQESKRIVREGVQSEINAFDKRALTQSINLKQQFDVEVIVLTMGPPQARDALVEALAMGADRAVHLLGREFAGADTLATARALALACRKIGFDLILCGKYSTDAETAQVPPMLAEFLDIPQVTGVTKLDIQPDERRLIATREQDDGFDKIESPFPALLTAAERLAKPIKVAPGDLSKGLDKPLEVWSGADLPADIGELGLAGSPTWVEQIYSIEPTRKHIIRQVQGSAEHVANQVVRDLLLEGLFSQWKSRPHEVIRLRDRSLTNDEAIAHYLLSRFNLIAEAETVEGKSEIKKTLRTGKESVLELRGRDIVTGLPRTIGVRSNEILEAFSAGPEIWVVAELVEDKIRPATFELLGRAVQLADKLRGRVAAVLIGHDVSRHEQALAAYGADLIYEAASPALAAYSTEPYTSVLANAIRAHSPFAVLIPSTANGRDLAPRVAARLNVGLTGDCIGLEIDDQGRLVQLKPAFGGNIVAPILTKTSPVMATVRPGMLQEADPDFSRHARVEKLPLGELRSRTKLISQEIDTTAGVQMDDADVIIGVGTGIGGPENLAVIREMAELLGAPIGGTRKVVDLGWLPRQVQIGLTGRSVSPRLYIAIGISGKFNHVVGIQRSGLVLAIDQNPNAEIFKQADYGIVGDWAEVVPALVREMRKMRP